jgi:hypothetical protein
MAQTDDFYACAAKRYFQYFTGIQVSLYDRTNPANATFNEKLSSEAKADREFVESLGTELRKTQSIRSVVKKIMGSPYYRETNYRAPEGSL